MRVGRGSESLNGMKRENLAGRGGSGNGKVGFVFADVWLAARYTSPYDPPSSSSLLSFLRIKIETVKKEAWISEFMLLFCIFFPLSPFLPTLITTVSASPWRGSCIRCRSRPSSPGSRRGPSTKPA